MSESSDCLFCRIVDGDIPSERVYSDDDVVAFRDIQPQAPVHVLFVPRRHVASMNAVDDEDAQLVGALMLAARRYAAAEGFADDGYRLVVNCNGHGCQTVFHLHLHLLGGTQLAGGFGVPRA